MDFTQLNGYNMEATENITFESNTAKIGYYWYTKAEDSKKNPAVQIGLGGHGVAFNFTSAQNGYATLSTSIGSSKDNAAYYRVLKNGEKLLPSDGEWAIVPKSNNTIIPIQAGCEVEIGDVISLEVYSDYNKTHLNGFTVKPTVTVSNGNTENAVGNSTFSPLWERPWSYTDYKGEFNNEGSVWDFNILNSEKPTAVKTTDANEYDSTEKYLYDKNIPNSGYIFADEQLKFKLANAKEGMALSFTPSTRGYYDFSTALNRLSGKGTVYARVLIGSKVVWPESGEWYSFNEDSGNIPALELGLDTTDIVSLQVYAVSEDKDDTKGITVGLGVPTVQRLNNRMFTENGNTTVYNPLDYNAFENGYTGEIVPHNNRFEYFFIGTSGEKSSISSSDTASSTLSDKNGNTVCFGEGSFKLSALASTSSAITFLSPMNGSAEINIEEAATQGAVLMRLLKNTEILTDWTDDIPVLVSTELKIGDKLILEIKGDSSYTVDFSSFNITVLGLHNNSNTDIDDGFYANFANPYGDDYYSGQYKESDKGYWKFKFYDVANDKTVNANRYSSDLANKLYTTELGDIGYYFGVSNLTAELLENDKGISLGFTAPREDTFNFRSGLRIITDGAKADLRIRIIKVALADGKTSVLWGNGDDWIERNEVEVNEDVVIPYLEMALKKGDTVYLQIYAASSNKEKLDINLVSPAVVKETPKSYSNSDISAKLYWAGAYAPYSHFSYEGNYVNMSNRWNFEYFDMTSGIVPDIYQEPTYYKNTGSVTEIIWKRDSGWPFSNVGKDGQNVTAGPAITSTDKTGISHRFTSPVDSEVIVCATPYIHSNSMLPAEMPDGKVCYRVVKKNISDGSLNTVWPLEGEGEWELLNNEKTTSSFENLTVKLAKGDELLFQFYVDAPLDQFEAFKARANAEKNNSGNCLRTSIVYTPVIVIPDFIDNAKRIYNVMAQWTPDLQISPYWRYEYAIDSENPVWKTTTKQSWGYWLNASLNYMGASNGARMWLENRDGSLDNIGTGAVAYTFTPLTDGFVTMGTSSIASIYGAADVNGRIRITVNGENVWPVSGWEVVSSERKPNPSKISFEAKAGDKVRFEFSTERHLESGESIHILWNPAFTFDKFSNIYSETSDIYNMLDKEMTEHFKEIEDNGEFNQNPEQSKKISDIIAARKAKAKLDSLKKNDIFDIKPNTNDKIIIEGTPGDYSEWTEETYTPGGGYKKIIRYITTSWWVYLLIALGIVLGVALVVFIVLFILWKKGKLSFKRRAKPKGV